MEQKPIIYDWANVSVEKMEMEYDDLILQYRNEVSRLTAKKEPCIGTDFELINEISEKMRRLWSPINHLKGVMQSRVNGEIYARCEQKASTFGTEISQNEDWYRVIKTFTEGEEYQTLSDEEKMSTELSLREFQLNGIDLPPEKKARYKEIMGRLTKLYGIFKDNLVASTSAEAWELLITDGDTLDGLSDDMKIQAFRRAAERGEDGFLFFLGQATYISVMSNAKNRDLRRTFYRAWNTRASDRGPNALKWDNSPVVKEILTLCHEKAKLLGFKNHAQYELATKMASSEKEVMDFQLQILKKAEKFLKKEMEDLADYAFKKDGIEKLEPWDIPYYQEDLLEERYGFSEEDVRPYFPLPKVLDGMFALVNKLYGISFKEREDVTLWHPDAKYFDMYDAEGKITAGIYMDFYERVGEKRSGAWMDEAIVRKILPNGDIQLPVGYLTCNFSEPSGEKPSLLTANETETLLHEFGHNLQHLLTECTASGVSGINGIPWDGVELASQFMENFYWTREGVELLSGHYKTGEKLPDELFKKMLASKTFGSGYSASRQLLFGIFDFRLYSEYNPNDPKDPNEFFKELYREIFPMFQLPEYVRTAASFAHIFGGGYAAGYYSYMWANVLATDAFEPFLKDGKIQWEQGEKFRKELLSRGGSRPFMESFIAFRGRKPTPDALMKQYGFEK